MDRKPPQPAPEKLASWLRYYGDLGIAPFYRDRAVPVAASLPGKPPSSKGTRASESPSRPGSAAAVNSGTAAVAAVAAGAQGIVHGPSLFEAAERVEGDTLVRIQADLGDCKRCKLHRHRQHIVFGVGNANADLVFVGEGPGHDEDVQGVPFVGRAGQLLTQMIEAMGLHREDVYIANVVKCRPPENRTPEPDEVATCLPFLLRQLASINPKVIVCLGSVAAKALLGTHKSISRFRGQWIDFRGAKVMPTYHPAYLLRNPNAKPEVWADLKKVMAFMGLKPPRRQRRS